MCAGIFDIPTLAPGWACCRCKVYNGLQREVCKSCKQAHHGFTIPDSISRCPSCRFGYDTKTMHLSVCPVCKAPLGGVN